MDSHLLVPEDPPSPKSHLSSYVGTAGWSYPDWEGIVYSSSEARARQSLTALSRLVDLIEIYVTFYQPVTTAMTSTWLQTVLSRPHFRFNAKAPSLLTHERRKFPDQGLVRSFLNSLRPIIEGERFGAILFQFPWSFRRTPENRSYLGRLMDLFHHMPCCIEMRHDSWNHEGFFEGLKEREIAFCNIDQPLLQHCLEPSARVTGPFAYVRLHGRNTRQWFDQETDRDGRYNYLYSKDELKDWMERIFSMQKEAKEIYVVTNNHYQGKSVVNALDIQQALGMPPRRIPETLRFLYNNRP